MAVEVECAGIEDPVVAEVGWCEGEAVVALPENGALAGVIDEDEGLLAWAARRGEEMRLHAEAREFGAMQSSGVIVANFADVARAQPPGLAGDHGGGNLAAGEDVRRAEFDFGASGRELVNGNERVGCVEADTDDVNFWSG